MRILVFGDSITYGAWDSQGGWVERVKQQAHKQTIATDGSSKLQVINLGIGGDTSRKILKRLESEIAARTSDSWPLFLIFSYGANDERFIDGSAEVSTEEFVQNTQEIIKIARSFSSHILFLGIVPIGKPVIDFKGKAYSDERIKAYDAVLQEVVEQSGVKYIPTRPPFLTNGSSKLFSVDGIHPNDNGHALLSDVVISELKNANIIDND